MSLKHFRVISFMGSAASSAPCRTFSDALAMWLTRIEDGPHVEHVLFHGTPDEYADIIAAFLVRESNSSWINKAVKEKY